MNTVLFVNATIGFYENLFLVLFRNVNKIRSVKILTATQISFNCNKHMLSNIKLEKCQTVLCVHRQCIEV